MTSVRTDESPEKFSVGDRVKLKQPLTTDDGGLRKCLGSFENAQEGTIMSVMQLLGDTEMSYAVECTSEPGRG